MNRLIKNIALLVLVAGIFYGCNGGVGPVDVGDSGFKLMSGNTELSDTITLNLGETISFSVLYENEILNLSGCKNYKTTDEEFSGEEGGLVSYTGTSCTYTAPSSMPASGAQVKIIATIANSQPVLTARLNIELVGPVSECTDAYLSYNGSDCSMGDGGEGTASYSTLVSVFNDANGESGDFFIGDATAESAAKCIASYDCEQGNYAGKVSGCIPSEFYLNQDIAESCGYRVGDPDDGGDAYNDVDGVCSGSLAAHGCGSLTTKSDCIAHYALNSYPDYSGYEYHGCGWNEMEGSCYIHGSMGDGSECTVSGLTIPLDSQIAGGYYDTGLTTEEGCNYPGVFFDDSSFTLDEDAGPTFYRTISFPGWGFWGQQYFGNVGILTSGPMFQTARIYTNEGEIYFYFIGGQMNGKDCASPGKIYIKNECTKGCEVP